MENIEFDEFFSMEGHNRVVISYEKLEQRTSCFTCGHDIFINFSSIAVINEIDRSENIYDRKQCTKCKTEYWYQRQ
ncbi:MAG: hypothetical protein WC934_06110 [Acidithiobacillus sp.]|jgi:uncharacterized protein with PIN domain|uniref:hypothetical protein n=1 Tax=Acidithiobacillus sp. TaxID=1872118 RepID=UPI00355FA452